MISCAATMQGLANLGEKNSTTRSEAKVTCPEDNSIGYFTGRTRTSNAGYTMKEYKCLMFGHLFWVRAQ